MGFVLLLRGTHALHASAVSVDGHGIAIVGAAGYGKSTTAAAFAKLGYSVMAEDVAALGREHGKFVVHPAYPCIRLWPESVNALFGAPDALPPLTPNWDKRYLELEGDRYRFQSAPLPLGAIYLLSERQDDASSPRIEAIAPKAGMLELIANAYAPHMKDRAARAQEFELLRKVVAEVPLRRVIPSTRLTEVHRLCDVILEDFRTLPFRGDSNRTPESCECL
jgi:ABC-type dipeptide/oligopeptide/nickel transport system ATPase component